MDQTNCTDPNRWGGGGSNSTFSSGLSQLISFEFRFFNLIVNSLYNHDTHNRGILTCNIGGYRSTLSIFLVCHGLTTIPRMCDDGVGQVNNLTISGAIFDPLN